MLFFVFQAHSRPTQVEILVDDNYFPYSYREGAQAAGLYNQVLRHVFSHMPQYRITLLPTPWPRGKKRMEEGQGFALAPVFYHGHDWPYLYPYSLHFHEEKIITVCNAGSLNASALRWPEDFTGLRIQNIAGFDGWGGPTFHQLVQEKKISYSEVRGMQSQIQMLSLGRVDCILAEALSFKRSMQKMKRTLASEKFIQAATAGIDPVHIGYSKPGIKSGRYPFAAHFRQSFDNQLYQLKQNGEIAEILSSYKVTPQK